MYLFANAIGSAMPSNEGEVSTGAPSSMNEQTSRLGDVDYAMARTMDRDAHHSNASSHDGTDVDGSLEGKRGNSEHRDVDASVMDIDDDESLASDEEAYQTPLV